MAGLRAQMATARALASMNSQGEGSLLDPTRIPPPPVFPMPRRATKTTPPQPPPSGRGSALLAAETQPRPQPAVESAADDEEGEGAAAVDPAISPHTTAAAAAAAAASERALSLNLKIQAALREELRGIDEALEQNLEVLKVAERRLTRGTEIVTSSTKYKWARAVEKFLSTNAHPGTLPARKEQEKLLRTSTEAIVWQPREKQVGVLLISAVGLESSFRQTQQQIQ